MILYLNMTLAILFTFFSAHRWYGHRFSILLVAVWTASNSSDVVIGIHVLYLFAMMTVFSGSAWLIWYVEVPIPQIIISVYTHMIVTCVVCTDVFQHDSSILFSIFLLIRGVGTFCVSWLLYGQHPIAEILLFGIDVLYLLQCWLYFQLVHGCIGMLR